MKSNFIYILLFFNTTSLLAHNPDAYAYAFKIPVLLAFVVVVPVSLYYNIKKRPRLTPLTIIANSLIAMILCILLGILIGIPISIVF